MFQILPLSSHTLEGLGTRLFLTIVARSFTSTGTNQAPEHLSYSKYMASHSILAKRPAAHEVWKVL